MNKLYGYIRWSTAQQGGDGKDSELRQLNGYKAICKQYGKTPLPVYCDAGLSSFKGANRLDGNLAELIKVLKDGDAIWAEDADRLSREEPEIILPYIKSLIYDKNITFIIGNEEINKDNYQDKRLILFLKQTLGHSENIKKSKRIKSAWQSKFNAVRNNEFILMNRLPFWLRNPKEGEKKQFYIKEYEAKAVQSLFEYALSYGLFNCLKYMLKEYPKIKWCHTKIFKTLKNKSVIGSYTIKENGTKTTIEKYYPAVISDALFYQVQERMNVRKISRSTHHQKTVNIFDAGFIKCKYCNGNMHLFSVTDNKYDRFICSNGRNHQCQSKSASLNRWDVEELFIYALNMWLTRDINSLNNQDNPVNLIKAEIAKISDDIKSKAQLSFVPEVVLEITKLNNKREQLLIELENSKQKISIASIDIDQDVLTSFKENPFDNDLRNKIKLMTPAFGIKKIEFDIINKRVKICTDDDNDSGYFKLIINHKHDTKLEYITKEEYNA